MSCGPNLQEISAVWIATSVKEKVLESIKQHLSDAAGLDFFIFVLDDKCLRGVGVGFSSEQVFSAILFLSFSERQLKDDQHKLYSPVI